MIRFGTCGTVSSSIPTGAIVVHSKGAVSILRNPDAFRKGGEALKPYLISRPVVANPLVSQHVRTHTLVPLRGTLG